MAQRLGSIGSFEPLKRFRRQTVCKPESDEPDDVLRIEMGQVVPRVPALVAHAPDAIADREDAPLEWRAPSAPVPAALPPQHRPGGGDAATVAGGPLLGRLEEGL